MPISSASRILTQGNHALVNMDFIARYFFFPNFKIKKKKSTLLSVSPKRMPAQEEHGT